MKWVIKWAMLWFAFVGSACDPNTVDTGDVEDIQAEISLYPNVGGRGV